VDSTPLSGPSLGKKRGDENALKLGVDFQYSNGWIHCFQQRHNTVSPCIHSEVSSVDTDTAENWNESVMSILDKYKPKDTHCK
jgi:hypothetical protein